MLTEEQAKKIKEQISQQIDSTFPEDKKADAKTQLEAMNVEQLEQFLERNNMVSRGEIPSQGAPHGAGAPSEQQCIFCSIISGNINSYKVNENANAVAILEINPISDGHTIILPKKHSEKIPVNSEKLAQKISKILKEKLNPKNILISKATLFGHGVINLVPIYKDETIESERHKASSEELEATLKKILEEKRKPIKKPRVKRIIEKLWLPRRIP